GTFNRMLEDVGIGDVGSFLDQFRNEAHNETKRSRQVARDEPDYDLPRSAGGNTSFVMLQGALNAYSTFVWSSGS
ncbi:unnamed protein product, partial [Rotaria sp. Silwood1]